MTLISQYLVAVDIASLKWRNEGKLNYEMYIADEDALEAQVVVLGRIEPETSMLPFMDMKICWI